MPTKVIPHSCTHAYQDKKYGKGRRVMNLTEKSNSASTTRTYRCTVCTGEITIQKKIVD